MYTGRWVYRTYNCTLRCTSRHTLENSLSSHCPVLVSFDYLRFEDQIQSFSLADPDIMLSLLFSLPADLIRGQIAPFFDLLSMVKLDSATLSKVHRNTLLRCVLNGATILECIQYEKEQFSWFILRGCRVVEVLFPAESEPEDIDHAIPVLCVADTVDLTDCFNLTNACVQRLVTNIEPGLRVLTLTNCFWLDDKTLQVIADVHGNSIVTFELRRCRLVSDAGAAYYISKCLNIEDVRWDLCDQIGTLAMAAMAEHLCTTLDNLHITSCPAVTEDSLLEFLQGNEDVLMTLTFHNNGELTDRTLLAIAEHCPSLEELQILDCKHFSDTGYSAVIKSCQCLTTLRLEFTGATTALFDLLGSDLSPDLDCLYLCGCPLLTDDHVAAITARASELRHITLSESDCVTDLSLQSIAANLPDLTHVSIQMCKNVAYPGVEALVRGCPSLVSVNLSMCPKICDACLDVVATHCEDLRFFTATDNKGITDAGVRSFTCANLEEVDFGYSTVTDSAVKHLIHNNPQLHTVRLEGRGAVSVSLQKLADRRKIALLLSDD